MRFLVGVAFVSAILFLGPQGCSKKAEGDGVASAVASAATPLVGKPSVKALESPALLGAIESLMPQEANAHLRLALHDGPPVEEVDGYLVFRFYPQYVYGKTEPEVLDYSLPQARFVVSLDGKNRLLVLYPNTPSAGGNSGDTIISPVCHSTGVAILELPPRVRTAFEVPGNGSDLIYLYPGISELTCSQDLMPLPEDMDQWRDS